PGAPAAAAPGGPAQTPAHTSVRIHPRKEQVSDDIV
ncbi:hypothetical protein GA0115240_12888, partial [Streptomyces sp. DvalAA-14]